MNGHQFTGVQCIKQQQTGRQGEEVGSLCVYVGG